MKGLIIILGVIISTSANAQLPEISLNQLSYLSKNDNKDFEIFCKEHGYPYADIKDTTTNLCFYSYPQYSHKNYLRVVYFLDSKNRPERTIEWYCGSKTQYDLIKESISKRYNLSKRETNKNYKQFSEEFFIDSAADVQYQTLSYLDDKNIPVYLVSVREITLPYLIKLQKYILLGIRDTVITQVFEKAFPPRGWIKRSLVRKISDDGDLIIVFTPDINHTDLYDLAGIVLKFTRVDGMEICTSQSFIGSGEYAAEYLAYAKDNYNQISNGHWLERSTVKDWVTDVKLEVERDGVKNSIFKIHYSYVINENKAKP